MKTTNPRMGKSGPNPKVPASWPTFIVKCSWRGTSLKLKIPARNPDMAWDKASKLVKKMQGGITCMEISVIGTT